jgi:AraC-like DNA-binding protein
MFKTTSGIAGNTVQLPAAEFQRSRHLPAHNLAFFIDYYWIVKWDMRGQGSYLSETLPQPCVHLVFEKHQSRLVGVVSRRFSRLLEDTGHLFGVSFKPGAFYPFLRAPISVLTDTSMNFFDVFHMHSETLEEALFSQEEEAKMIALVEQFLCERVPEKDEQVVLINEMVDRIRENREITSVDHLVNHFHRSKRTLQRLFRCYVGVSPKWVINRYRLQEAAEQVAQSKVVDWSKLALDLGYFDQAHFINDFKQIIGKTPAQYAKCICSDASSFLTCDLLREVNREQDL